MERLASTDPNDPSPEGYPFPISTEFADNLSEERLGQPLGDEMVLGDYILEEQIAHGGMGVIYRARQVSLARRVAIKLLLLGRYSSVESVRRFHREAQAAAALHHPNIVSVFEVGECEGQPFLAMEYVEGSSLTEIMKQGPLAPVRAARYAQSIAEALEYAHSHGVLHRDIKPSNVLIDPFDQVRLTDFGLAKKLDGSSDMTLTGQMIGSPNYLSPEQAACRNAEIGPPSDIYGIGAMLYELLTGRPPFMAQSLQDTLLHIRETDPVPPADLNPAVPRDLDTITLKCLEKVPAQRYVSARALAEDLGHFLRREPISARPISLIERTWKAIRRHRMHAALIATALGSLLCLTIASLWFGIRVDRARAETEAANRLLARNLFVREWHDAEQLVDEEKTRAALMWFARVVRQNPTNLVAATRLLGLLGEQTFSVPAGQELQHPAAVRTADFSPDGTRLVTGALDGKVRIWSWREGRVLHVLTNQSTLPTVAAAFLPDSRILVADHQMISVWSRDGTFETSAPVTLTGSLRWTVARDGRRAAIVSSSDNPQLWDPSAPRLLNLVNYGSPKSRAAPLSPDGRYVLRSGPRTDSAGKELGGHEVGIWEVDSGRQVWRFRLPKENQEAWMYSGAFSDDNTLVAFSFWGEQTYVCRFRPRSKDELDTFTEDPPLWKFHTSNSQAEDLRFFDHNRRLIVATQNIVNIFDLESGELLPSRIEHFGLVNGTSISPDGTTMATASVDGTVRFWDLRPERPRPLVVNLPDEVWDVALSPDGSWFVASGNPNAEVRDFRTGALRYELPMKEGIVSCAEISPDGRRIAVCTERGSLRVWDSATGAPVTPQVEIEDSHQDLSFSADGRWLCVGAPLERVWLLDAETARPVFPPFVSNANVVKSIVTRDHRTLISVNTHGHVQFWSLPDCQPRPTDSRHKGVVWTARLNADSTLLATASSDQTARIWEVASGKVLHEFRSEKAVYSAVFSPDGRRLLIGSADRTARVLEIASGRQISESMHHPAQVWFAEFSSDGRLIATGDDSGKARLWDAESGLPLSNWLRSQSSLRRAPIFTADGLRVITASADHTVKIWPVTVAPARAPSWLPALTEAIAGRRLGDDGTIQTVPFEEWQALQDQLTALADDGFYTRWARWFLLGRDRANPVEFLPQTEPSERAR